MEADVLHKFKALQRILDAHQDDSAIVFCNTRRQAIDLDRMLWGHGYSAGSLHELLVPLYHATTMRWTPSAEVMDGYLASFERARRWRLFEGDSCVILGGSAIDGPPDWRPSPIWRRNER